jgi:hypothetical protein
MRLYLLAPVLASLLAGCATPNHTAVYASDHLKLFAYQLGATHAALAECDEASNTALAANLETARFALQAQTGPRLPQALPAFYQGLLEPQGKPSGLVVDCSCADALLDESRLHNLALYRQVALPLAFRTSATQP